VLDEKGEVKEILCTYFPETRSGSDIKTDIKAKGVIHWVDAKYGVDVEYRRYQPLLTDEQYPDQDYAERLNKDSEVVFSGKAEPYIAESEENKPFQLMRTGYYKKCTQQNKLVLSEIVTLKDNFNK
jgi:glutaminyl-tRNA synthetase